MRQLSRNILFILFFIFIFTSDVFAYVKGGVEYSIPTDYSKLSEIELKEKADTYYFLANNCKDGSVTEEITNALLLYSILQHINPEETFYAIRQGVLYDKLGADRYAKGSFSKAIAINKTKPEAYFYFGEFYYKREEYRKAIKYYNEAYIKGYDKNYEMLYRMGDIYEKFGDTRSALKYLNEAKQQSPNPNLESKIKRIESVDSVNREFYSETRIRLK